MLFALASVFSYFNIALPVFFYLCPLAVSLSSLVILTFPHLSVRRISGKNSIVRFCLLVQPRGLNQMTFISTVNKFDLISLFLLNASILYSIFFKGFLCFYPSVCGFDFVSFFFTTDLKSIHIAVNSVFKTWVSVSLITVKSCIWCIFHGRRRLVALGFCFLLVFVVIIVA